jgi:glycine betaine/proline transport system permease protein
MIDLKIGYFFEIIVNWLKDNWDGLFEGIEAFINFFIDNLENFFEWLPWYVTLIVLALIALKVASKGVAIFTAIGLWVIYNMNLWPETMDTFALVVSATLIALILGIPAGIWASKSDGFYNFIRPILDFMQTLPAFVYLIPAVLFFGLGKVPGAVATVIFSMPPAVRFTNLAIRQVPKEVVEASDSFGATPWQKLIKVELPIATPTIFAGINQTIMLALSMVVISAMIGAGGLGKQVLNGITQYKIGLGFESGIAVVILAMVLDRITQALGNKNK